MRTAWSVQLLDRDPDAIARPHRASVFHALWVAGLLRAGAGAFVAAGVHLLLGVVGTVLGNSLRE